MNANIAGALGGALRELDLDGLSTTALSVGNRGSARRAHGFDHTSLSTTHVVVEFQLNVNRHGDIERRDREGLARLAPERRTSTGGGTASDTFVLRTN